jgi:hypothetical protein
MKKIKIILAGLFILFLSFGVMAQSGPPDPPGGHGEPGDQPPAGAAVGGGLFILLSMGAAYGGKKVYDLMKAEEEN